MFDTNNNNNNKVSQKIAIAGLQEGMPKLRDKVVDFYKSFKFELSGLMDTLTDDTKDLELDGKRIAADQKNGAAGTFLISQWQSEQEFIFSQLLENYKFLQTLEKTFNQSMS